MIIHQFTLYYLQAWERNKRKGRSEKKNDFSTMKKKLYDALRQCNYIDPVKDLNKNSQQTGNYKAFKFLNEDETEGTADASAFKFVWFL